MELTRRISVVVLLLAGGMCAQTPAPDLQTVLGEVRELRQELKSSLATIQRTNILLYRLQLQEAVVARAQARVDEAHAKLAGFQSVHKRLDSAIKTTDDARANAKSPAEQENAQGTVTRLRAQLDSMAADEQDQQGKVTDSEQQLRVEQGKLGELQDGLDQIDRALKAQ